MRHWQRVTFVSAALFPFGLLFRAVVSVRRALYVHGFLRAKRLPVPVVVVGNIDQKVPESLTYAFPVFAYWARMATMLPTRLGGPSKAG